MWCRRLAGVKGETAQYSDEREKDNCQNTASAEIHEGLYQRRTAIRQGICLRLRPSPVQSPNGSKARNSAAKCSVLLGLRRR